jgi:iron only hydrogenase large subunit-like protein
VSEVRTIRRNVRSSDFDDSDGPGKVRTSRFSSSIRFSIEPVKLPSAGSRGVARRDRRPSLDQAYLSINQPTNRLLLFTASQMSSVFLADVDDYLSPSTACVNPAFATGGSGDSTTTTVTAVTAAGSAPNQQSKTNHNGDDDNNNTSEGVVRRRPRYPVVRRGGGRGGGGSSSMRGLNNFAAATTDASSNSNSNSSNGNKKVTASIVDCLACSGCVTTAETVLLKEHSVDKFREMLIGARSRSRRRTTTTRNNDSSIDSNIDSPMEVEEEDDEEDSARVVITLSIASAAELLRLLRRDNSNNNGSTAHTAANLPLTLLHRKLASLLCRQLHVDAVLDGQLALEWSLHQSGVEFCERYRQQQYQPTDNISTLVSSSCPATVCYVEKTCPSAVPHLARVVSPLGCARAYLSSLLQPIVHHHVAVMPCHDKKLEATRPTPSSSGSGDGNTTTNNNSNNQNVLVLTTSDCWQLLLESIVDEDNEDEDRAERRLPTREDRLRRMFESLPPADVDRVTSTHDFEPRRQDIVPNSWITSDAGAYDDGDHVRGTAPVSSLLYTSGGYADYIFRFAAHRMFGTFISHVDWNAVSANNALALSSSSSPAAAGDPAASASSSSSSSSSIRSRPANTEGRPTTASARVAAARREILEAILYRHEYRRCSSSGSISAESVVVEYSQHEQATAATASEGSNESPSSLLRVSSTPVLRFAMAHGLQVMQRAISNAGSSNEGGSRYHYVEAMACPSGCLNGGGQVLLPSASSHDGRREPPSEVKARVESASRNLRRPPPPPPPTPPTHPSSSNRENLLNEQLQTSFHAVQPLQLQYGAAKGMAVKDIQW